MPKKKFIAFIVSYSTNKHFRSFVSAHYFFINKISQSFNNTYIINLNNLNFFTKSKIFKSTVLKDYGLEKKIKFFFPKNINEFDSFMKNKNILGFNWFGINLRHIKIFLLIKKYQIKLVQISNIGNVQTNNRGHGIVNWSGHFFKIYKEYSHKFIVLLSNLSIIPKMEIRFVTNSQLLPKNRNKTIYQKFFNKFNLGFAKKIMIINSRSFDIFKETIFKKKEKYIILLDEQLNEPQWTAFRKPFTKAEIKKHYEKLNEKLKFLSSYFKRKIVICIHPNDDLQLKKKYFKSFKVVQHKTREYIYQSFLVLFFESSAIIDAVILKKRIMTINSKILDSNQKEAALHYVRELGVPILDIDKKLNIIQTEKKMMCKKYPYYINKYIVADKSKKLGYKKIINTLKQIF